MKKYYRSLIVVFLDILILVFTDWLSLAVRFDFLFSAIPTHYINLMRSIIPVQIPVTLAVFLVLRMYKFIWHAVTVQDAARMIGATLAAYVVNLAVELALFSRLPLSTYAAMLVLQVLLFTGMRCIFRFTSLLPGRTAAERPERDRILVIGAGSAGNILIRELQTENPQEGKPVCIIDDNRNKHGKFLCGVPIVGGREKIADAVKKYKVNKIIFAIPTANLENRRDILTLCAQTGCKTMTMPSIGDMLDERDARVNNLQSLRIEDLLVITDGAAQNLTEFPKELQSI